MDDFSDTTPHDGEQRPHRAGAGVVVACILFSIIAGAGAGLLAYRYAPDIMRSDAAVGDASGESGTEPAVSAAAKAMPSVVGIDYTSTETTSLPSNHPKVEVTGSGAGVAFRRTKDGGTYIITNDHVVKDAKSIKVTGVDGAQHAATIVGTDAETDIAVIKVATALPVIAIGSSERLRIGQTVYAIGSPFGLRESLSAGVVSALHRSLPDSLNDDDKYPLVDVIQTDASINPGNSGGALVDRLGRLVGVPTAIFSETGGADGVGFAIPARTAMRVAEALISTGKAEHPFLGILGQTVTSTLATQKQLPVTEGAYVVQATKGGGAANAGVKSGDVIVRLGSTAIRSMDDLLLAVKRHDIGDEVELTLYRGGKKTTLTMKVGVKPE